MIHLICALKPEAMPVVDHFDLKRKKTTGPFKLYHSDDADMSLTISGVGKSASASAVQFTWDYFNHAETDPSIKDPGINPPWINPTWINVGIAGHLDLPTGQAVLIKKISDGVTRQTWYPSMVIDAVLPVHELLTLEQPGKDYKRELFDMEGAGFFRSACRFSALELIQLIKIVADNPEQPMDNITPHHISRLIENNLTEICEVIDQLTGLSGKLGQAPCIQDQFLRITAQRHFTVYQQHQLRSLLKKWRVLYPHRADLPEKSAPMDSGRSVLEYLRRELEKAPIDMPLSDS